MIVLSENAQVIFFFICKFSHFPSIIFLLKQNYFGEVKDLIINSASEKKQRVLEILKVKVGKQKN